MQKTEATLQVPDQTFFQPKIARWSRHYGIIKSTPSRTQKTQDFRVTPVNILKNLKRCRLKNQVWYLVDLAEFLRSQRLTYEYKWKEHILPYIPEASQTLCWIIFRVLKFIVLDIWFIDILIIYSEIWS